MFPKKGQLPNRLNGKYPYSSTPALNTGEVKVRKNWHIVNGIMNDPLLVGAIVLLQGFEVVDFTNAV